MNLDGLFAPALPPAAAAQRSVLLLYLSLFLLLLALFMVMGAFAREEVSRSELVLNSVHEAFGTTQRRPELVPSLGPVEGDALDRLAAGLQAVAEAGLGGAAQGIVRDGRAVRLSFAAGELYLLRQTGLRPDRTVFLDRLARLVQSTADPLDLEISIDAGDLVAERRAFAAQRVGALARALAVRGLGEERLAAGLRESTGGRVHVLVRLTGAAAR